MSPTSVRLSQDEIAQRLHDLRGWDIRDGKLTKAYTLPDFISAVGFVDRIAPVAESEGHHPDLQVGWGRVVVQSITHDAGGLTEKDFRLASLIDKLQA